MKAPAAAVRSPPIGRRCPACTGSSPPGIRSRRWPGMHVLMKGGNAFDAAIAVGATLNMMEPQMNGIGGNGFMTLFDKKSGKVLLARDGGRGAESAEGRR